jgi:hypothetical protein
VQLQVFNVSTSRDIDAAFTGLVRERSDADASFHTRRVQLDATAFSVREYVGPPLCCPMRLPRSA